MQKITKCTIGIILYKNTKYIEQCLRSLLAQTYTNFELLLRDQDENSWEALEYIKKNCPDILLDERVKVFPGKNLWHSGGHNFLISEISEDSTGYVCASNDMLYEHDFLEKLVDVLQENSLYSVAVPKLKRWNFDNQQDNEGRTEFIDSCGIGIFENHHFFDIGQGEKDTGQYDNRKEIFGASGALFLVRKKALEHVAYQKNDGTVEFFDENIHYKNDIDLAYRLWWADEKSCFVPEAVAFHDRQVCNSKGSAGNMGLIQKIIRNNKNKPLWVKESSFLGYLVLLYKNVCCFHFPFSIRIKIFWYVLRATGFLLLTEPKVLLQYKKFWSLLPDLRAKKSVLMQQKKVSVYMLKNFFNT